MMIEEEVWEEGREGKEKQSTGDWVKQQKMSTKCACCDG